MKHVLAIAQRPHPIGSAEHDRVRDYLVAQFSNLGLGPQIQNATGVGTRYADAGRVQNIQPDRVPQMTAPASPPFSRPFGHCAPERRVCTM